MRSSLSRVQEVKAVLRIGDDTMQVIEYALGALELRSQTTANNVANAEVPGFQASRVSFEDQLRRAIDGNRVDRVGGPEIHGTGGPADLTGNNVNLGDEVVEMMKTNLLQQSMVEAFNFKSDLLRSAIRGQ
jgi:flagellar basal-body rod protein FlgB